MVPKVALLAQPGPALRHAATSEIRADANLLWKRRNFSTPNPHFVFRFGGFLGAPAVANLLVVLSNKTLDQWRNAVAPFAAIEDAIMANPFLQIVLFHPVG